jgi:hypothetical protein
VPHWKSHMDRDYLFAFDLNGKDVTLTIDRVVGGEIVGPGGKKSKKPLCYFREGREKKPLGLNSTNCKAIAALYGNDTDGWVGKRITLFPTTTQMGGETVDCIRVRPRAPADAPRGSRAAPSAPADQSDQGDPPPPDDEPGSFG